VEPKAVVVPEKSSAKSQYVAREKATAEKQQKQQKKDKAKKKFVNLAQMTKRYNGVIIDSEQALNKTIELS